MLFGSRVRSPFAGPPLSPPLYRQTTQVLSGLSHAGPVGCGADTWSSFGSGAYGRNANPGSRPTARKRVINTNRRSVPSMGAVRRGRASRTWVSPPTCKLGPRAKLNYGWFLCGFEGNTDGRAFSPSETSSSDERPLLSVECIPADVQTASFQQSDNFDEYQGAHDTMLLQSDPMGQPKPRGGALRRRRRCR